MSPLDGAVAGVLDVWSPRAPRAHALAMAASRQVLAQAGLVEAGALGAPSLGWADADASTSSIAVPATGRAGASAVRAGAGAGAGAVAASLVAGVEAAVPDRLGSDRSLRGGASAEARELGGTGAGAAAANTSTCVNAHTTGVCRTAIDRMQADPSMQRVEANYNNSNSAELRQLEKCIFEWFVGDASPHMSCTADLNNGLSAYADACDARRSHSCSVQLTIGLAYPNHTLQLQIQRSLCVPEACTNTEIAQIAECIRGDASLLGFLDVSSKATTDCPLQLSPGAIMAISLGSVVAVCLVFAGCFTLCRRAKPRQTAAGYVQAHSMTGSLVASFDDDDPTGRKYGYVPPRKGSHESGSGSGSASGGASINSGRRPY